MTPPNYFFALFGDPRPPEKDTVESGIYHPDPKFAPFPTKPGDILLLYCAKSYLDHPMEVPGLGIVFHTDDQTVNYRYLPFVEAIPKSKIDQAFEPDDIDKFRKIWLPAFWLFEISKESFVRTVGEQRILWP